MSIPLPLLGLFLFGIMIAVAFAGSALRRRADRRGTDADSETQEGYLVSAVLGLLALLIGFTFAMAIDRFEARRLLVLEDANAIQRLYLQAQLLDEPHRSRISGLLLRYTENHVAAGKANAEGLVKLAPEGNHLSAELWRDVIPAFNSIRGIDFSSTFVDSANQVVAVDTARRAARAAQIPSAVFGVLFVYVIIASGILGYVLLGRRARISASWYWRSSRSR